MINVRNLHKKFDRTQALDGIELTINRASIYGLVGTNGAGKTTLIRHMAGILKPDEGEILFDGEPVLENTALKQKIGLVPDELYFPKGYSISDMVRIYSGTYDNFNEERLHELTQLFRLDEKNQPTHVAGCPPDGFAADGQLWGNPLYNWEVHRQSGFSWWLKRIEHCFSPVVQRDPP